MEKKSKSILWSTMAASAMIGTASLFSSCNSTPKDMGTGAEIRTNMTDSAAKAMPAEGKCGADSSKAMESKCGADSTKMMDGKCGASKTKDAKCGEAKCGESKKK